MRQTVSTRFRRRSLLKSGAAATGLAAAGAAVAGGAPDAAVDSAISVLVIEDELSILEMITGIVNSVGLDVLACSDGARARELAPRAAAILCDFHVHDEKGSDIVRDLRRNQFNGPVILVTGDRTRAEDCFQETWIRVLERGHQYDGKSRFEGWLFSIARNLVIDLSRKRTMASLDEMREGSEDSDSRPFEIVQDILKPLFAPLATTGIVVVFVVLFLLQREDLHDRFIRLVGP